MKHSLQVFLTTSFFIAATTNIAMELEITQAKNPNILAEITCIRNPRYAQYLSNNHVVITGSDGCSIVDPKTNTEIKKLCTLQSEQIVTHPNQTLFALLHYGNTIGIYDTKKDGFIWKKTVEGSLKRSPDAYDKVEQIRFNPHDSTIFVIRAVFASYATSYNEKYAMTPCDYKITNYNYITNQENSFKCGYNVCSARIAINPTQHEICIVHPFGTTLHTTNDKSLTRTNSTKNYGRSYKNSCEYSPNGSYIVQGDCHSNIYIINSQNTGQYEEFKKNDYNKISREDFKNILFYSNSILAISSQLIIFDQEDVLNRKTKECHTLLSYWNIHTKELVHVSPQLDASETYNFSFSPNKTKVIIALKNECVILPVPFKVICKDITEERFLYLLFVIQNIKPQSDIEIPQDIKTLISSTLLRTCKR